jgi:acyl-CoA dehydrogenase
MTDGAARLIDRYCAPEDRDRLLPHIYTTDAEALYTGAMFLTEKSGGSDVGANLVSATQLEGAYWALNGEKWFCSNANAEVIFVLARTNAEVPGTRGLSIFLVEKTRPDGSPNPMEVVRLKDKLGVRSMASAECLLQDTWGKLVGREGEGFKIMSDMINLSRLYNAVASLSELRRGLIEAYTFLLHRESFGKPALQHALIREKLWELGSRYVGLFYMCWQAIYLLDEADNGNQEAAELLRLLTPMLKKEAALAGVYGIRESMELMGGLGYIEDTIMPKLMRDTMVLPIWEGAGNIMVLDMLRASAKSRGLALMLQHVEANLPKLPDSGAWLQQLEELKGIAAGLFEQEQDRMETTALYFFGRLSQLYQLSLLQQYQQESSREWIAPALDYFRQRGGQGSSWLSPPAEAVIHQLMGWEIG